MFLREPRIALDNNHTERSLRGVVVEWKEPLRLAIEARHRGSGALLQPGRVREGLRGGLGVCACASRSEPIPLSRSAA